jgi:hypothetical protein
MEILSDINNIIHGHFTLETLGTVLYLLGLGFTFVVGYLKKSPASQITEKIQLFILNAEKSIDKQMYSTNDEYNQAKEDAVVCAVKLAGIKTAEDKLRIAIKALVEKAHADVSKER